MTNLGWQESRKVPGLGPNDVFSTSPGQNGAKVSLNALLGQQLGAVLLEQGFGVLFGAYQLVFRLVVKAAAD